MSLKKCFLLLTALFFITSFLPAQGECTLFLKEDKLIGSCENSYFTGFEIHLTDSINDSIALFKQLPLTGIATINHQYTVEVRFELTERAGFAQILFKSSPGWFTMDHLLVNDKGIYFTIDHDPDVPVTRSDLRIVSKVKELLQDEDHWHKDDDRDCDDDIQSGKYSLFCALQIASLEVNGEYNHRSAIMQKVRHTIAAMYPDKTWEHRLRDFNNMPETSFTVLNELLEMVEEEVVGELKAKSNF